jgi:hypothetical protein
MERKVDEVNEKTEEADKLARTGRNRKLTMVKQSYRIQVDYIRIL